MIRHFSTASNTIDTLLLEATSGGSCLTGVHIVFVSQHFVQLQSSVCVNLAYLLVYV